MIENLLKIICELGIFIVCAQTVCCFRPKAAYEKYLKFLVGIMILLIILSSVSTFWGKENKVDLEEKLKAFYTEIEKEREEAIDLEKRIEEQEDIIASVEGDADKEALSVWGDSKIGADDSEYGGKVEKINIERIEINEASDG